MKNKKHLIICVLVLIGLIGLSASLYLFFKNYYNYSKVNYNAPAVTATTSTMDLMSDEEKDKFGLYHLANFEVLSRDASGTPITYRVIGAAEPKPLEVEFMSKLDKMSLGVNTNLKIQVIARDSQGKIVRYKVINKDSDIVTSY
jgi:hypothetical protein